ncbi:hypothetical protein JVT61DRAFT_2565 [Boletus reticuloceps]|uniref:Uncharacterized protein n=1 Tax=Boletus reticuloceps TaxID=495285 RepID=A0A8I2YBV2_9AGAM|nr:hypothetical protein JVT61DRAFT_2565 [Boletus reticuloceps]
MDLSAYEISPVMYSVLHVGMVIAPLREQIPAPTIGDVNDNGTGTGMRNITWPTSSPVTGRREENPNTQDLLANEEMRKTWEIHWSNAAEEKEYKWKSVRDAILELTDEHTTIRFRRMPALIRIIWDAHWEAIERAAPASTRFAIYVQIKMEIENADGAPCLTKLRHMIDAMGKVDILGMYSAHAERLYGLGSKVSLREWYRQRDWRTFTMVCCLMNGFTRCNDYP